MTSTRLCIVRHGETDWNTQKRIQGHRDIPLNAEGRAQAAATAAGLARRRFDALYSSDLTRAWQTAEPIAAALGLPLKPAPFLRERHYGQLQGLTAAEVGHRHPALHAAYAARDPHHDFGGGEPLAHFARRIAAALDDLALAHSGQTLLLVAHGGVLDIVYRLATGRDLAGPRDFPVPNGGLNWLEHRGGRWHITAWGELGHLDETLDEVTV